MHCIVERLLARVLLGNIHRRVLFRRVIGHIDGRNFDLIDEWGWGLFRNESLRKQFRKLISGVDHGLVELVANSIFRKA
jgi:hypothetical protein